MSENVLRLLIAYEVEVVKSQNVTSPKSNFYSGQEGGRRKPPYAFTEQGIQIFVRKVENEDGIQLPFTYIGSGHMRSMSWDIRMT